MSVNGVSGSSNSSTSDALTKAAKDNLGKDDFLKLMLVQLQNQDPLDPVSNEDYIAQLAQFSQLEQTTNLNKTMEAMSKATMAMQASNMIGRTVIGMTAEGTKIAGVVTGIDFIDGVPTVQVGTAYFPLANLVQIS